MLHKIGMDYGPILKSRKNKRQLPYVARLQKTVDIQRLQGQVRALLEEQRRMHGDFAADPASSEHNYHLKNSKNESFIKNYDEFYRNYSVIGFQTLTDEARTLAASLPFSVSDLTPIERLRGMRHTGSNSWYHPHYDERNYTAPTSYQTGAVREALSSFQSEACRSALVVLNPGQHISPHFDIGPEFISRLHIPIFTNEDAVFGVRDGDGWLEFHMPADGGIYFVNSGFEHYAVNRGSAPRFQIRVCLNGQDDLEGMRTLEPLRRVGYGRIAEEMK